MATQHYRFQARNERGELTSGVLQAESVAEAAQLLRAVHGVSRVEVVLEEGGQRMDVMLEPNAEIAASELAARLLAQGYRLARLQPEQISLETAFMRLTKGLVS